jgi:protease-4
MKQFFKFMFASMLGTFLTVAFSVFILLAVVGVMISSVKTTKDTTIKSKSVLLLDFQNEIPDRNSGNPLDNFDFENFETNPAVGLNEILANIKKAKNDDNISGIYLNAIFLQTGAASIEEIRDALLDFKSSGKFIYSYAEAYSQSAYYLATTADEIHINPAGYFDFKGLSMQLMFFKGAMEKLDIQPQIIRHGKFKSAIEPFVLDKMSPENRAQSERFIGTIWEHMVKGIAEQRGLSAAKLNELADKMSTTHPKDALEAGLVDKLSYEDEVISLLKEKSGLEEDDDLSLVKLSKYVRVGKKEKTESTGSTSKDKIAVVYANGEIRSGKNAKGVMGSETIAKAIRQARKDEHVKAIVLRVNSPGGSALASDVIWREVTLAKAEKPLVVSMGDVAASGGYYIACAADRIVASENTITGSIGVFGLVPNMKGFFNNKLGITIDTVKTNRHSDINTVFRPMTKSEKAIIQQVVENIYSDFISKVAEGRGMTVDQVDSIGQGRVWSGQDALKIGLIDELGGLEKAIDIAAELAEIGKNYKVKDYPENNQPFHLLLNELADNTEEALLKKEFGQQYMYYKQLHTFTQQRGIFARMPFDYLIE